MYSEVITGLREAGQHDLAVKAIDELLGFSVLSLQQLYLNFPQFLPRVVLWQLGEIVLQSSRVVLQMCKLPIILERCEHLMSRLEDAIERQQELFQQLSKAFFLLPTPIQDVLQPPRPGEQG